MTAPEDRYETASTFFRCNVARDIARELRQQAAEFDKTASGEANPQVQTMLFERATLLNLVAAVIDSANRRRRDP